MFDPLEPDARQRVLVVDDEPTVREVVCSYLTRDGYDVAQASDGAGALSQVSDFDPDLILLDVMLPKVSGLEVLRRIRQSSTVPVVLLTARADETDRILGLEFGADDYVVKPFSPRELVARVRAVLRRSGAQQLAELTQSDGRPIIVDGLSIDPRSRQVFVSNNEVRLTAKEFDLLHFLSTHPHHVFTRAELLERVWASSVLFQDPATVTVHIRRIRHKIESNIEQPRWIHTVFGVGYRFEHEPSDLSA